ncbi:MAG: hypothetical protein ACI4F4_11175 [Lachnospiraceae bacterium]
MLKSLIELASIGMADTGDSGKPWLVAICMIVSIVVVVGLFILSQKSQDDEDDDEDESLF